MLKNHLKIAFRQLKKQKFYSAVNIIGLAIGVTCCLLIALFVRDELSYDQHHPNVENLYLVARNTDINSFKGIYSAVPPLLAQTMVDEIPEVKKAARLNPHFFNAGNNIIRKENQEKGFYEDGFVYADQELFELFDLPLLQGDKENILKEPYNIVITKKIADKYFQNENPIGKTLNFNNAEDQTYKITGVMENIKDQNHFHYDFFMSMITLENSIASGWLYNNYYTYVSLTDGTTPAQLKGKLHDFVIKNMGPEYNDIIKADLKELAKKGEGVELILHPVKDIHLRSAGITTPFEPQGDIAQVKMFGVIALFILLIALVNFINLSTARSANRAKEVGLRKVLGSFQKQLINQFLTESVLMSLLAFLLGTSFAILLMPMFNELSGKDLSIPFFEISFFPFIVGSAIVTGILAGLYPSFYLSAFQPVKVLKGKLSLGSKSGWLRSGLVVFQFSISIGLIVGTVVVYQQMSFIQNKNLGFDKNQVLLIEDTYTIIDQLPAFKDAIVKLPEAKNAAISSYLPLDGGRRNSIGLITREHPENVVVTQCWNIDDDYLNTLSMNLLDGRNFNEERLADSSSVILNETAVRKFGFSGNPIGQVISIPDGDRQQYTVIGIVEDFNFESLKGKVTELALFMGMSSSVVSVKSTAAEMDNLIAKTEAIWKSFAPTQPFRYDFLDDRFAKMYKAEDRVSKLFGIFSLLAILIACLGLLALATFMTEQRMKEIGIRKVLGASVTNIVFQLSKTFLLYVLIGLIIAAPIAWLQMNNWLNNFEYRIEMQWWMIALAGVLAIGIAFLTVGSKTMIAAMTNPVDSLKNE